jgi:hypothetical protein
MSPEFVGECIALSRHLMGSCPVSNRVLGRLCRASPEGLPLLVKGVSPQTRAMLAAYCLQREHLSSIGLTIAASCEQRDLLYQGGRAVLEIIQKLRVSKPAIRDDPKLSGA